MEFVMWTLASPIYSFLYKNISCKFFFHKELSSISKHITARKYIFLASPPLYSVKI